MFVLFVWCLALEVWSNDQKSVVLPTTSTIMDDTHCTDHDIHAYSYEYKYNNNNMIIMTCPGWRRSGRRSSKSGRWQWWADNRSALYHCSDHRPRWQEIDGIVSFDQTEEQKEMSNASAPYHWEQSKLVQCHWKDTPLAADHDKIGAGCRNRQRYYIYALWEVCVPAKWKRTWWRIDLFSYRTMFLSRHRQRMKRVICRHVRIALR